MITRCRHCRAYWWKYRPDFPPPGYCSVPCYEQRHDEHRSDPPPPEPHVMVRRMREHNRFMHEVDSALLGWDCEACDRLQAEYAESLEYHQARATAELVKAGVR